VIHVFCVKKDLKKVKNGKKASNFGKKTGKNAVIAKKSLGKIVLVLRVVIKKFSKKMKKSLVE
jgi:hypothetical protein